MHNAYETISCDRTMVVPTSIARCATCQASVYLSFDRWELEDDGTWTASEESIRLDCSAEPDLNGEEWDEWHAEHAMPWVDRISVRRRVWIWVTAQYRFDVAQNEQDRIAQQARLQAVEEGINV